MMTLNHKKEWTLREVSEWTKQQESLVSIPALQRGLVWKPQQVELLWDSILRRFPIGSLTLSSNNSSSYHLLDGQQRWSAISLGYNSDDPSSVRSILWFDLKPEKVWDFNKTTRKFIVRATTKAHPWGYAANDECKRLNTEERRAALLDKFCIDSDVMRKKGIALSDTYPVNSGYPLPLCWLLEAGEKSDGNSTAFVEYVRTKIEENRKNKTYRLIENENLSDDDIVKYKDVFEAVTKYSVHTIYLEQSLATSEEDTLTDMEILFERIGKGGTPISESELIYSSIKAYWPEYIKTENDRLADMYMPPHLLISLGFRLSLSPDGNGFFVNSLSVNKVRSIAKDKDSNAYKSILALYQHGDGSRSKIDRILEIVDFWLTNERTIPTVLRTSIARNSPDVYLLLMSIAQMHIDTGIALLEKDVTLIRACAFYLHWMIDKSIRGYVSSYIYKTLKNTPVEEWSDRIKAVLMEQYTMAKSLPLIPKDTFNSLFGHSISSDHKWRTWEEGRTQQPWWPLWNLISNEREVLLYSQRGYMCQEFPNYDPAKLDMWAEYNRPWDYDHIIPQDWLYQYRGRKRTFTDYCCDWKDNNGNMAAIPFEVNRSKSNASEWTVYMEHQALLLMDEDIKNYDELFHPDLTARQDESQCFAQMTFNRLCKIYSEIYDLLLPVNVNEGDLPESLNDNICHRKELLMNVAKKLDCKVYFEHNGKEYPLEHNDEWAKPWLSTGIITKNGYFAAITIGIDNECQIMDKKMVEIGLRRMPGSYELTGEVTQEHLNEYSSYFGNLNYEISEGSWWHFIDFVPFETSVDHIAAHLTSLVKFAEANLK